MKKKLIAAGAAGLTVATVVTGLSFGSTAFSASPATTPAPTTPGLVSPLPSDPVDPVEAMTSDASELTNDTDSNPATGAQEPGQAKRSSDGRVGVNASPYKLILEESPGRYLAFRTTPNNPYFSRHTTLSSAQNSASELTATENADGTFRLTAPACLGFVHTGSFQYYLMANSGSSCASFRVLSDGTIWGSNTSAGGRLGSTNQWGIGVGNPGYKAVGDLTPITPIAQLSASVTSVDHLAGRAVISGSATRGATVQIGDVSVVANATTGAWSLTVPGLAAGANPLTVVQKINNVQVGNSVPITVTIVEGGTVVPVPQPGVELVRGETTSVPFVVQFNERREAVSGTVTVTAPAGTTFAAGQTTVPGLYRNGTTGEWRTSATTGLTGGTLNADRTQMTFTQGPSSGGHVEGQQWRYEFQVETPLVAAAGSSSMGYVFAGSTPGNPFRAEGSTTTTIEVNEQPTVASVVSVDPIAKTAVVSGTATPGATITIGDQEAVVQDDGNWSMTVEGLQVGSNQLVVQQSIAGEDYGDPVTLDAVVPALTTSLGANDVTVTSEADGWFTEGTEGTVTITTQTGTSPTGATVRPGESLSWTTTLPEGFEAGDLPATETVDGWTTEHVVATDSEGRQTVEVKVTNATTENREYAAAGDITFPVVSTGKPTADGTITTVFTPPTSYTSSAPDASTVAKAPLPLTATVAQRNDIAQTVVVTGSGTPGQQVTIGDVTETIRPDGSYEITAPFTGTGDLEVTVSQEIGGTVHDEATVEFTSVEGGTLVGVQQTRVNLPRNTTSIIPIVVQNNEARDDATGTVTFTAPKDTIFQDGLTILGERRSGTAGGWESDASLDLTGGVISENGTKITFQLPARAIPAEQQLRYLVEVFTSRTASAGNRQLDYTYEGTSSIGDFRATGSTIGRVASIDPSAIRE
ncbi:hypothetical protein [Frigoribacterium sp. CFBP 13707]|uniref:hypothetical protein n=1 Tax=Frigoribacterium sp. CFBP 13707 TaxID=2775313 RepID=UPI0017875F12|nr:hypothetical protein [Frigoribacterium sp. CFBP 13707]MBD8728899.1 hypothetical protein [Frigoribacterium sp. CFBP 13707]